MLESKVALGQDRQRKLPFKIAYAFCLSFPIATFALQHGSFVLRKWLAAKVQRAYYKSKKAKYFERIKISVIE